MLWLSIIMVMVIRSDPYVKPSTRTPQCGVDLQIKVSHLKRDKSLISLKHMEVVNHLVVPHSYGHSHRS
jgi:hypothetical protein